MGIIHKLKPEVKDYIVEQKTTQPTLSCRALATLTADKFQIKVSKSSINSIIKESGLSMPVGRRLKKKKRPKLEIHLQPLLEMKTKALIEKPSEVALEKPTEIPIQKEVEQPPEVPIEIKVEVPSEIRSSGAILLKAADYLIGGSYYIAETIKSRLGRQDGELLAKIETLIYMPLFEESKDPQDKSLIENIKLFVKELQESNTITQDILRIISTILREVRCIKVNLSDGGILYLDGQLHTVWSTPHIPYDFSAPIYNIKNQINKYFYKNVPLVLFMAPGYDVPSKEFFNFMLSLDSTKEKISGLSLEGNKFEELESIPLEQTKKHFFIFGLWPWQFVEYRKVKKIGEFKKFYLDKLRKDFYLAEVEIELFGPISGQSINLKGCALKTTLTEKARLIILSNLPAETSKLEDLADAYLSSWPNLEEAFQDFSRKIELFTYTADSQRFFSTQNLNLSRDSTYSDIKSLFNNYLKALDLYVRWHFMPSGFEDEDFSSIKTQFYDLGAILKKERNHTAVTFQPPQGFRFLKELEYTCRRLNERKIISSDGTQLFFS